MNAIRERKSLQILGLMLPGGFWLIVFFALPLLVIFVISFLSRNDLGYPVEPFTLDNYQQTLDPLYLELFLFSLWISPRSTRTSWLFRPRMPWHSSRV
jgi:spermidine/putrescine transport system permease protein